jgi:predicted nucleotidyltransferase
MNIFESIFRHLNNAKIKYLVVGGVAVNLYGYSRFTGDLDIIVLLEEENLKKLDHLMKQMSYSERIPVSLLELKDNKKVKGWLERKNLKAYSFIPPKDNLLQIDIIIEESLKFNNFYKNKTVKRIDNIAIPIVSLDDLVKMKKKAHRGQDILDVKSLNKLIKL